MSRLRRQWRRLAFLGLLLAGLLVVLLVLPAGPGQLPSLSVYSAAPNGAKALRLWLDELGYPVRTIEGRPYRVPRATDTVLVLAPVQPLERAEVDALERWVRDDGGRLILGVEGFGTDEALDRFGLGLRALPAAVTAARPLDGGRLDPLIGEISFDARQALDLRQSGARALVGDGEHVFVAERVVGTGRVVVLADPGLLSNRALRQEGNARLALSLVGGPGAGSVVFDELHHGFGASGPRSLLSLLFERAWGQAALYAALLSFAYLVLCGRRFGAARPLVVTRGRSLSEYVTSLAGLYRAGGKRAFLAEHFRRRLRRELATALGAPGDASDEEITARARALGRDPAGALSAVAALGGAAGDEGPLVRAVGEAEAAVDRLRRVDRVDRGRG